MLFRKSHLHGKAVLMALMALAACSSCADLMEDTMYNRKNHESPETLSGAGTGIWDESRWDSAKWGE